MEQSNQLEQEEVDLFDIKKLEISPEISKISEAVEFNIQF